MNTNILNIDPTIDLKQCILWQYQNSASLKSLILSKEKWYSGHQAQFWQDWYDNVFNIETANDFGLSVWGQILDFSRNVTAKDGSIHYLTTEQYRMVLKGQMLRFGMGASAPEINKWLSVVFAGKGAAYCLDTYDMTAIPFVFRSEPTEEIKWLLGNIDFFPRPAGVGYQIRIIPSNVFGFNGSGLKPFNQGVFANDYSDVLQPAPADFYQLHINAPTGATVVINGETKSWSLVERGSTYTWTVSQSGYVTASGTGIVQGDEDINISVLKINNTSGVGTVFINNQNATGAFFQTGSPFNFSYSVGFPGYISLNGNGTISNDREISVSSLLISPNPSQANVVLNGENARGAFFVTGSVFEYAYTASYPGLISTTGSGYVTENSTIQAKLGSGSYSVTSIKSDNGPVISDVGQYTAPAAGYAALTVAAQGASGYGAKAVVSNLSLSQGDVITFRKINGSSTNCGCGVAVFINELLQLVVGGGAISNKGGSGYVGGYPNGNSIDGTVGNSYSYNLQNGDGGRYRWTYLYAYGGSGYNDLPSSSSVSFDTNSGAGFINLTFNPK